MATLGEFLKTRRDMMGWTLAEAGDRVGISASHFHQFETGRIKTPAVELRRAIADAFGVRHLDILVAMGELSPDEIEGTGAPQNPFPHDDPRHGVVERLLVDDDLLDTVLAIIAFADRDRGVNNRK